MQPSRRYSRPRQVASFSRLSDFSIGKMLNWILERDDAYGAIAARSAQASDRSAAAGLKWRALQLARSRNALRSKNCS
jgi:hypothetical protein